jgi:hypothetical protein
MMIVRIFFGSENTDGARARDTAVDAEATTASGRAIGSGAIGLIAPDPTALAGGGLRFGEVNATFRGS